jgi:hypothetical protein
MTNTILHKEKPPQSLEGITPKANVVSGVHQHVEQKDT